MIFLCALKSYLFLFVPSLPYIKGTTGSPTPQNNRLNEEKQSLCACVLNFGTLLYRPLKTAT